MSRIPPESELLEFARYVKTGTVHILAEPGSDGCEVLRVDSMSPDQIVDTVLHKTEMLCGFRVRTGPLEQFPAVYVGGDEFADQDLCISCVQALGAESWRAFHADSRVVPEVPSFLGGRSDA